MSSWNQQVRNAKVVILTGLLVLFCLGLACADGLEDARRRGKLLVGVKTDFPPFGYLDDLLRPENMTDPRQIPK